MDEKLKEFWEKIKSFFAGMSKRTKIILGIVLAVILIIFLARWIVEQTRPYEVVFRDLTNSDLQQISAYILETGVVGYKIEDNTILMPEGEADALRAAVYMLGLPNSGGAYETYNSMVGSMSTDTDKETAAQYDLEVKIASTIRNMSGVFDASVTISYGEDRRYVLDSSNMTESSAYVYVELNGTQPLSTEVASGIRLAVSHAVADLSAENVAIVDNMGNTYTNGSSGVGTTSEASYLKLELEQYVSNQIRTELMGSLSPIYGMANIRFSVGVDVDIDRKMSVSTEYTTPEYGLSDSEDPRGIINSEVWSGAFYGDDGVYVGGLVGATANSDIPMYPADTDGDGVLDWQGYTSGQVDYAIPETTTQREELAGVVKDVQIGITINTDSDNGAVFSAEELTSYVATVTRIHSDYQDEKVAVLFAPFSEIVGIAEEDEGIPGWVWFAIIAGLALFLIIVVIIIIMVRKKKQEEEEALAAAEEEERRLEAEKAAAEIAALAPVDGADIMDVNTEKSMELRKDLRTFVGNNPEIAASLLRNLMKGGEPVDAS